MIKFEIRNRWTGSVQFTAEIECAEDASTGIKLGLAVKWALKTGASLDGASLDGASLRPFKADMWMTLTQNRNEVPGLIKALREGRVDGGQYEGDCACLVGTIAKVKRVPYYKLDHSSSHPAEQWFMMIREGDKPGEPLEWKSRKWLLSPHMTDGEIVQTAFKAVMTAIEHEAREQFRYRGVSIFDPHYDVEKLVELRSRPDALIEREAA